MSEDIKITIERNGALVTHTLSSNNDLIDFYLKKAADLHLQEHHSVMDDHKHYRPYYYGNNFYMQITEARKSFNIFRDTLRLLPNSKGEEE